MLDWLMFDFSSMTVSLGLNGYAASVPDAQENKNALCYRLRGEEGHEEGYEISEHQGSIVVAGHKTSVNLEDALWKSFKEIANQWDMTLSELAAVIDADRKHANLSSAIRQFVLAFYRDQVSDHQGGTRIA
jgi:predicted DNA-binding ribbon-helix-helix protein